MGHTSAPSPDSQAPLADFSQAHAGIMDRLKTLQEMPALIEPAQRLRDLADDLARFFQEVVLEHHKEEERELFPAVLASAREGEERARIKRLVDQLTDEHRDVEAKWKRLRPHILKLARGQAAEVDPVVISNLVKQYERHARFEEAEFLPLAHAILGRNPNHLSALALSLHMRRQPLTGLQAARRAADAQRPGAPE